MAVDWDGLVLGPVMGTFGEEVIYTPRGQAPISIPDGVFDEESADIQIGTDGQTSTQRKPTLGLRMAWFPTVQPAQSDRVTIVRTGVTYIVKDLEPDGHGHVRLVLQVAAQ